MSTTSATSESPSLPTLPGRIRSTTTSFSVNDCSTNASHEHSRLAVVPGGASNTLSTCSHVASIRFRPSRGEEAESASSAFSPLANADSTSCSAFVPPCWRTTNILAALVVSLASLDPPLELDIGLRISGLGAVCFACVFLGVGVGVGIDVGDFCLLFLFFLLIFLSGPGTASSTRF